MIPYLRIYDLSVINYLKYEVLPPAFTESVEGELLVPHATIAGSYVTNSTIEPSPVSPGRGWVPFDEAVVGGNLVVDTTAEQAGQITVYGATTYKIDYPNGRIFDVDAVPTSVDYNWNYVSVIEGWPGSEPPPLPIVAVDMERALKSGYQLGGGSRDTVDGTVYVFATDEGEKRDITDVIYQSFFSRTIPIRNWHEGGYLDYDGTYADFSPAPVSGLSQAAFLNVEAALNISHADWSELNRHRSKISFTLEVFKSA